MATCLRKLWEKTSNWRLTENENSRSQGALGPGSYTKYRESLLLRARKMDLV